MINDVLEFNLKKRSESFFQQLFKKEGWNSPIKHRKFKGKDIHPLRDPSPRTGMLIMTDGTPHDWFGNGHKFSLHMTLDDATGEIKSGWFTPNECMLGYCYAFKIMIEKYGIPDSLYSDKTTILWDPKEGNLTHVGRMLGDLGINLIYANSPEAKGKIEKQTGWKEVYGKIEDEDNDDQSLPLLKQHETITVNEIIKTTGQTTPPAYFNEATLLSAMENPIQFTNSSSKQINTTLKNTGGLGTVATRADIIEKLFNTFLIEKHGNDIRVTSKGKQLLQLVPQDLKEPELTAKWEMELAKIAKKQQKSNNFINEIKDYTQNIITEISSSQAKFKHENLTTKKCPNCGELMLEVNGKKGKMLVCSNPDCKHRETISIVTNARCPNCHKKLELVGKGDKQMFVCKTCGYRQHMNAFKKERENKSSLARKSDVKKYMNQQKKQQTSIEDSPFAALLKLKDDLK